MPSLPEGQVADAVYAAARAIPPGRVATYGQVADLVEGFSVSARMVGQIMAFCPPDVPWQRVVGAGGALPIAKRDPAMAALQRRLLDQEGVKFRADGRVDMTAFQLGVEEAQQSLFDVD